MKPKTLLEKFKDLVEEVLTEKKEHFSEKLAMQFEAELRKIPVTLKLTWNGTEYRHFCRLSHVYQCEWMAGRF